MRPQARADQRLWAILPAVVEEARLCVEKWDEAFADRVSALRQSEMDLHQSYGTLVVTSNAGARSLYVAGGQRRPCMRAVGVAAAATAARSSCSGGLAASSRPPISSHHDDTDRHPSESVVLG